MVYGVTASAGDNSLKLATTAFVTAATGGGLTGTFPTANGVVFHTGTTLTNDPDMTFDGTALILAANANAAIGR